jgi:hypothetical protein
VGTVRVVLRATTAVLVPLALLVLAGCGGSADSGAAARPPATSSATSSATASTDPRAGPAEVSPEDFAAALATAGEQATTATVEFAKINVRTYGVSGDGVADFGADPFSIDLDLEIDHQPGYRLLAVAGEEYLSTPASDGTFAPLGPGDRIGSGLGRSADFRTLDVLVPAVSSVVADDRVVDGQTWRLYAVALDLDRFPGLADTVPGTGPELEELSTRWLFDQDGFLREVQVELGTLAEGFRYRFDDWGRAVDIGLPSAA